MRIQSARTTGILKSLLAVLLPITSLAATGHAEPGRAQLSGVVFDPSTRAVVGATVTLTDPATGSSQVTKTYDQGQYQLPELPAGKYELKVRRSGLAPFLETITLMDGPQRMDVTLQIPTRKESVTVPAEVQPHGLPLAANTQTTGAGDSSRDQSAAELLADTPGVSLRQSGDLASAPMLHGMGDERVKLVVDGLTVSNSCPNHMNPPLSYVASSSAAEVTVMAGITPVSMGGDSIGGTVIINSPAPVFAGEDENWHSEGVLSAFFRNNGGGYGPDLTAWVANHNFSMGYSGSWADFDDYSDGSGHKVTSTYAQTTDNVVTLAAQDAGNLVVLQAGLHHTPYEGFPNAQMDLVRNIGESLNLRYRHDFGWGVLDARGFWQGTWHSMNIGEDKSAFPMSMWMPMNTHGRDSGCTAKLEVPVNNRHTLRLGSEVHHFLLDDHWPAVPGTEPYMAPDPFLSIYRGQRTRLAWFGEVVSQWNSKWTTLLGIRNDTVWMNTGQVSGYSDMYAADAEAFNAVSHARTDINLDATALARYELNRSTAFEIGYARKTRSPNLYERYAWSTNWMASGMIGWFGDGNYYVGNLHLKPEVAHTVSGSAAWHDAAKKRWALKVTPYQTYVQDYIDADLLATTAYGDSTFAQLRFANHKAKIYGVDGAGNFTLWDSAKSGHAEITGVVGYLHGDRLDTGTGLYHMMPLNARTGFEEKLKRWSAGLSFQAVDRKSNVDPLRFEPQTPGYGLLGTHASYDWGHMRLDAGGENLLNRYYELPLGGVNFDDYMAGGWMGQIRPLTGRGRSLYVGLTLRY